MSTPAEDLTAAQTALTEAQSDLTAAQAAYDEAVGKVRTGDASVTPDDLTAAQGLATFAQLRVDAAQANVTAAEQAVADRKLEDLDAAVVTAQEAGLLSEARIDAAQAAFEAAVSKAMDKYVAVIREMNATSRALHEQAHAAGVPTEYTPNQYRDEKRAIRSGGLSIRGVGGVRPHWDPRRGRLEHAAQKIIREAKV